MSYASGTQVSVERSKAELDALLRKHGATQRGSMENDEAGTAIVVFTLEARQYRLEVPLPKLEEFAKKKVRGWPKQRTPEEQRAAHEQASRERWRAVVLLIKAKLEIVALHLSSFEKEFLADLVLADGRRVHDALKAPIASMYETGRMPPLLGAGDVNQEDGGP